VVYLRRASAKEPPIRPVPRIVTRLIRWGGIGASRQPTAYSRQPGKEREKIKEKNKKG
jgi:hypothetical protein